MATKSEIAAYTEAATDGWIGVEYDHQTHGMLTSSMHAAYCIGRHLADTGRTAPKDVRPGRGDLMHANDMLFRLDWQNGVRSPLITRER